MVGKRKANSMMNQIAKMTKQIDEATEDAQNLMLQHISCQIERLSPIGCVEEHLLFAGFNTDAVTVSVRDRMFQQYQCLV